MKLWCAIRITAAVLVAGCSVQPTSTAQPDDLEIIYIPAPEYPREARHAGVTGCVLVSFEVTKDGLADRFQILDSQPKGVFDHATLASLSKAKFGLRTKSGRHARVFGYEIGGSTESKTLCMPLPTYESLNADSGKF